MKTRKIFLAITIFMMGFILTASSTELRPNPVTTNIEIDNDLIELSNQLINDPFCDTDYIVEKQKELLNEFWYQEHKQNFDKKEGKRQHGKGHGKFEGKDECSKKHCKKDCKKECLKHKDSPRGKDFEKRGEFKREFGRPMFHGNDSIKFEHPRK